MPLQENQSSKVEKKSFVSRDILIEDGESILINTKEDYCKILGEAWYLSDTGKVKRVKFRSEPIKVDELKTFMWNIFDMQMSTKLYLPDGTVNESIFRDSYEIALSIILK